MNFCNKCGARLVPGVDRCPVCGAPCVPPVPPARPPEGAVPEAGPQQPGPVYAQSPQPARPMPPPPVQSAPPQPGAQAPQASQAPQGPRYCAEPQTPGEVPSVWWYFGMMLLFIVPVVGLVAMLCFSFLPGCSPQQRNLARAGLLLTLILAAALAIGLFLFTLLMGSVQQMMLYSYYGLY